ncbi:unnamed protein product [[Actinomadura] parvosata subsp. kistnae]|nr:unnamed protein product [Actinomadura parvosata subsp. kistnae]
MVEEDTYCIDILTQVSAATPVHRPGGPTPYMRTGVARMELPAPSSPDTRPITRPEVTTMRRPRLRRRA